MTKEQLIEMRLIDRPDCQIDFNIDHPGKFGASSAGKYDEERLHFFTDVIFPEWQKHEWSLHELDHYLLEKYGIELWSYDKKPGPDSSLPDNYFSFWMRFTKEYPGDILVQCFTLSQQQVN